MPFGLLGADTFNFIGVVFFERRNANESPGLTISSVSNVMLKRPKDS